MSSLKLSKQVTWKSINRHQEHIICAHTSSTNIYISEKEIIIWGNQGDMGIILEGIWSEEGKNSKGGWSLVMMWFKECYLKVILRFSI